MKLRVKKCAALLLALCMGIGMSGCMARVIAEDSVKLDLPDIDPEDGAARELAVTLYYRLANEEYLIGVNGRVSVRSGERAEAAVIRALTGAGSVPAGVAAVIPADVSVQELAYEDGLLSVTLSGEFLNEDMVTSIKEEDYLREKDYNNAVRSATQEMYTARRLGVLSIVNTIAGSGEDVKVQIYVQQGGSSAVRLTWEQLGLADGGSSFLEPMGFVEEVVAAEKDIAACMLGRMQNEDYEKAYALVTESRDAAKPSYDEFEAEMRGLGKVVSYEITDSGTDDNGLYVLANVRISSPGGTVKRISNAALYMAKEGEIYKVGYGSLLKLMES